MARQIKAKFGGKCAHCNGPISVGDPVMYEPEARAVWHIECHQDRMSTAASPVKPVQEGTTARYRKPPEFKAQDGVTKFFKAVTNEQPNQPTEPDMGAKMAALKASNKALDEEYEGAKTARNHALQQSEEVISCLKRTFYAVDDACDLRKTLNPCEVRADILKTLNAILGAGWNQ